MIRPLSVAVLILVGGSVAYAQSTGDKAIAERKALMKQQSAATKDPATMLKGDMPFDLAKVQASLKTLQETSTKAKTLFPDDSKTGGDTRAQPAIWEKKAQFLALFDKLNADTKAAAAAIKDEATFKTEFLKAVAACDACHKDYRAAAKR
jgi:cytochrome c556